MKTCPYCGSRSSGLQKFCAHCGIPLAPLPELQTAQTQKNYIQSQVNKAGHSKTNLPLKVGIGVVCLVIASVMFYSNYTKTNNANASYVDRYYEEACDALGKCVDIYWDVEEEHSPEESEMLWKKTGDALKKAADATNDTEIKCDYAEFLIFHAESDAKRAKNKDIAVKYLEAAADNGSARAECLLSAVFSGDDDPTAMKWFEKAVKHKYPLAMHVLADSYWESGNKEEALKLYRGATGKVKSPGQIERSINYLKGGRGYNPVTIYNAEVGYIYEYGLAGEVDLREALKWYKRCVGLTNIESVILKDITPFDSDEAVERVKRKMKEVKKFSIGNSVVNKGFRFFESKSNTKSLGALVKSLKYEELSGYYKTAVYDGVSMLWWASSKKGLETKERFLDGVTISKNKWDLPGGINIGMRREAIESILKRDPYYEKRTESYEQYTEYRSDCNLGGDPYTGSLLIKYENGVAVEIVYVPNAG